MNGGFLLRDGEISGLAAVMAARGSEAVQEIEATALVARLAEQGQVVHREQARL